MPCRCLPVVGRSAGSTITGRWPPSAKSKWEFQPSGEQGREHDQSAEANEHSAASRGRRLHTAHATPTSGPLLGRTALQNPGGGALCHLAIDRWPSVMNALHRPFPDAASSQMQTGCLPQLSTDLPKSSIEPFSEAPSPGPSGFDAVALMMNATAKGTTAPDAVQIIYLGCLVAD